MARLGGVRLPLSGNLSSFARGLDVIADTRAEKLLELTLGKGDPYSLAYLANHSLNSHAALERLSGGPRPVQSGLISSQGGTTPLGRLSRLQLSYYLKNTLLRDGDQMSMANSVELRTPYLDADLVEEVLRLPVDLKVRRNRQKPLLVAAVGGRLPKEVVNRPKMGFTLPYDRWLRSGVYGVDPLDVPMGLDRSAIRAVRTRFEKGADWTRYWALQVLASWVDQHGLSEPR